jgi:ComF family protein
MQPDWRLARTALHGALDFALPPRCPGCGAITAAADAFCLDCWSALELLGPPCCETCALPFPFPQDEGARCAGCLAAPPPFDRLRAAVGYGDLAGAVAIKLKYGRKPGVARIMARLMQRHVDAAAAPLLAPVPLHRWRIWQRGYNQSALIAAALARVHGLRHVPDLLVRTRATPPLKGMSPRERRLAVRGAIALNPRHAATAKGATILIVDDVFTTGATASACAQALKRAGAARVELLCWARVMREEAD